MINRTKHKINYLRQQPEHVRIRAANKYILVISAAVIIISLLILLPLQIFILSG